MLKVKRMKALVRGFAKRRRALIAIGAICAISAITVQEASAETIYTHPYLGSFNGAASIGPNGPVGPFQSVSQLAFDNSSHLLYAINSVGNQAYIEKFDPSGSPQTFSGLGPGVTAIKFAGCGPFFAAIGVDNSGTSTQGQIYASSYQCEEVHSYAPDGTEKFGYYVGFVCGDAVDPQGRYWRSGFGTETAFNSTGASLGPSFSTGGETCKTAIDSSQPPSPTSGYFYSARLTNWGPDVFQLDSSGQFIRTLPSGITSAVAVDPTTHNIFADAIDHIVEFDSEGHLIDTFGAGYPPSGTPNKLCESQGITVDPSTQKVYVSNCGTTIDIFGPGGYETLPNLKTGSAQTDRTTAVLSGAVDPDGGSATTSCFFEWGTSTEYDHTAPCSPVGPFSGTGDNPVSANLTGLEEGQVYHYRLSATNAEPTAAHGPDRTFKALGPPAYSGEFASHVVSDGAKLSGEIEPGGSPATYRVEYGTADCASNPCASVPAAGGAVPEAVGVQPVSQVITGLTPDTTYHWRLVAENETQNSVGADHTFNTFPSPSGGTDTCPNALIRKQTSAANLLDCRAYELASASFTGGFDVESDLVPGQVPLAGSAGAQDSLLYALHYGAIPGIAGNPTNFGPDPYVATRGGEGWTTSYDGLSAKNPFADGPFSSSLIGSDAGLDTFAFGGPDICSPCFEGESTGIPLRKPDGSVVQGMRGSEPVLHPTPSGTVRKSLSANGAHLVFGSTQKFEPDGNENGDVSIYDRNLQTGLTHVVSKKPDGSGTMTGSGIGELDLSENGSRVLIGRLISTDVSGNGYWHLYMNVGDSSQTIDLTPTTTSGVLYDGMTGDGTKVFFSTPDKLTGGDTDLSADLYSAEVTGSSATLTEITNTNSDSCNPAAGAGAHWNRVSGVANCDAVGLAGGTGVSRDDGTAYLLSPEQLDGSGATDAPNLFVVRPGSAPEFVATLAPTDDMVGHAVSDNEAHRFSDLQVTANGDDAVFSSRLSLTGYPSLGKSEIYRYDAPTETLACVSCPPTEATPSTDTTLSSYGLNLTNDGRVFFSSREPLTLRDTNEQEDAYEWEDGTLELISSGASSSGSGMLSVSASGVDAFFFTRQVLAHQDRNGSAMKIYDARSNGGFFSEITSPPCQASDECHGAGTQAAPPPQIGTLKGTIGNVLEGGRKRCRKGFHRKNGRCVRTHRNRHRRGRGR